MSEPNMSDFERELSSLINKHSLENDSDTPDFLLASYLRSCLEVFSAMMLQRERWWGRKVRTDPEPPPPAPSP